MTEIINEKGTMVITASEGMIFRRKLDGFEMGQSIALGIDYSTGEPRIDLPEYYEEMPKPEDPLPEGIEGGVE